MQIRLDKNTGYIINKLEAAGYSANAVGGAVRDSLLGRAVSDFDIATSALPSETKAVFSEHTVLETGIKHGTVTLLLEHKPYEITTYRVESAYTDSRHPDSVSFVRDLESDLSRRDFTVNALAYSPKKGLTDLFGGVNDLNNGIIRTVGNPADRFSEDALRILRALRFASVLGFEIEGETSKAIFDLAKTVKNVSGERIYTELKKLLCGVNAQRVINGYYSAIKEIIPASGDYSQLFRLPLDFSMRLTCLCGSAVTEALSVLRADNATKVACGLLLNSKPIPGDITKLKLYISALGREESLLVAAYRRALFGEDELKNTEKILSSGEPLFIKDLAVNGNDLLLLGIKQNEIGITLNSLLQRVLRSEIKNEKEALLKCASFR